MTSANATDPKAGDTVRVIYGVDTFDALVIRVEDGEVTVRIIWNDPTTPEDEIKPFYVTYPSHLILPKD